MSLSNSLKLLGISIFVSLHAAAAADEMATPAELARLTSSQLELQADFDLQLDARVDSWIDLELSPVLTERMTRQLRAQNRLAHWQGDMPPAAMLAVTDDLPMNAAQQSSNTACEMMGRTLVCVLRDLATQ